MRNRTKRFDAAELWRGFRRRIQRITRIFTGSPQVAKPTEALPQHEDSNPSQAQLGLAGDWPRSSCFGPGEGQKAPMCPRCGRPVRADGDKRQSVTSGVCHLPWNAGWDGACAGCGHRFEVMYETRDGDTSRVVTIEPAQELWPVFIDSFEVFAGVKITVVEEGLFIAGGRTRQQSVFLRMPELIRLAESLKSELSICQSLYDWDEDDT